MRQKRNEKKTKKEGILIYIETAEEKKIFIK